MIRLLAELSSAWQEWTSWRVARRMSKSNSRILALAEQMAAQRRESGDR